MLGGGTCYLGAWLPPGMELTVTGTFRVTSVEDGTWVIEGEDGTLFHATELPTDESIADGTQVTFHALTLPSSAAVDGVLVTILSIEIH